MQKPFTLIIPSWYPTAPHPLNGIFIEKHVELIARFQNVVVMYVTTGQTGIVEEKVGDSYIKYIASYAPSDSRLVNQLKYVLTQRLAYKQIREKYGQPARLHLNVVYPAGIFVWLLLLFRNIPLIITEHWSGYTAEDGRYERQMGLFKYLTAQLFKKARKISVVSQYLKTAIIQLGLADDKKICIVSNILNPPDPQTTTTTPTKKALFIGNLNDHEKNISMLIEAIAIVVQRYPSFTLTLIGGGGAAQRFRDQAAQKGLLNKNMDFIGYVPNAALGPYYQAHSFFILTSNFETFNIAAAEALLHGLPVVSTRCGGPSEYITDTTGIWIEEKTPEATAAAIMQMIERRSTFDPRTISSGMIEKYGPAAVMSELKNLYDI